MTAPTEVTAPRWQRPFRLVGSVLAKVYVEPVVEGRLRLLGWPRGLPLLAVIATAGYLVAMAVAVAAPWLRSRLDLQLLRGLETVGVPSALPWIVVALLMVAATLLQTGALHAPWWLRIPMLMISFSLMTTAGSFPNTITQLAVLLGSGAALVIFQLVRWRAAFRWWEYVVVAACFAGPLIIGAQTLARTQALGGIGPVDWTMLTMPQVGLLAAPVALLAGYAIAQWAFATVIWSVDLGRRQLPSWVLVLVLVLLLVWRLGAEWLTLVRQITTMATIVVPGALMVSTVVVWLVLDKIADRRGQANTRLADLSEDLRSVALPIAVIITCGALLSTMFGLPLRMIGTLFSNSAAADLVNLVSTFLDGSIFGGIAFLGLMGWAVVMAVRADRGRAELLAVMAMSFLVMRLFSARGATDLLGVWVVTPLVLIFLVLVVSRRLTRTRLEGMLVAAGLATVLSARQFFADPVNAILGGSAALVLSLVWQFLTSGSDANGDSARFPRPSRVLLLLGNSLLGMAVLAYNRITLDTIALLETMQLLGDRILGGSLILGSIVAVVTAVFRSEDLAGPGGPAGSGQSSAREPAPRPTQQPVGGTH